jgi:hypothetical protein
MFHISSFLKKDFWGVILFMNIPQNSSERQSWRTPPVEWGILLPDTAT